MFKNGFPEDIVLSLHWVRLSKPLSSWFSPLAFLKMGVIFSFFLVFRKLLWLLSPFKDYWEWLCDDIYKDPQGCILSHPVDFMSKWLKCSLAVIFLNSEWYCIPTDSVVPPHLSISSDVTDVWLWMDSNSSYLFLMCLYLCTNTWDRLQLCHLLKWNQSDDPVLWVFPLYFPFTRFALGTIFDAPSLKVFSLG